MEYIAHNAIIVTSGLSHRINTAYYLTKSLFGESRVTPIYCSHTNQYYTFFVTPDGSKERWEESNKGDETRIRFFDQLSKQEIKVDAVDVRYGGDEAWLQRIETSTAGPEPVQNEIVGWGKETSESSL